MRANTAGHDVTCHIIYNLEWEYIFIIIWMWMKSYHLIRRVECPTNYLQYCKINIGHRGKPPMCHWPMNMFYSNLYRRLHYRFCFTHVQGATINTYSILTWSPKYNQYHGHCPHWDNMHVLMYGMKTTKSRSVFCINPPISKDDGP